MTEIFFSSRTIFIFEASLNFFFLKNRSRHFSFTARVQKWDMTFE